MNKEEKLQITIKAKIDNFEIGWSEKYKKWYNITKNRFAKKSEVQEAIRKALHIDNEEVLKKVTTRSSIKDILTLYSLETDITNKLRQQNADKVIFEILNKYEIKGSKVIDRETNAVIINNSNFARSLKRLFENYYDIDYKTLRKLQKQNKIHKEVIETIKLHKDKMKNTKFFSYATLKLQRKTFRLYRIRIVIYNAVKVYETTYESDWIVESYEPVEIVIYGKNKPTFCAIQNFLSENFGVRVGEKDVKIYVERVKIDFDNVEGLAFKNIYMFKDCEYYITAIITDLR